MIIFDFRSENLLPKIFHSLFQFCFSPLLYLFFSAFSTEMQLCLSIDGNHRNSETWFVRPVVGAFFVAFCFSFFFLLLFFFYLFFLFFFFEIPYTVFECFRDEDRMCMSKILKTDLLSILQFCAHRPTGMYTWELFWKKEENTRYPTTYFVCFSKIIYLFWLVPASVEQW